jgi:hypothetical protein
MIQPDNRSSDPSVDSRTCSHEWKPTQIIGMPENRVDDFVIDTQDVKVRCKGATEGVPIASASRRISARVSSKGLFHLTLHHGRPFRKKPAQKPTHPQLLRSPKRSGHNGNCCKLFPKFVLSSGGRVAQLGERLVRNEEAGGSNPLSSTRF